MTQKDQIAELEARIAELEGQLAAGGAKPNRKHRFQVRTHGQYLDQRKKAAGPGGATEG